jgi:GTP cyclohydrolase I
LLEENKAPLEPATFRTMLAAMLEKLEAEAGRIEVRFPYFVNKTAPVSGVQSLLDYEVTLTGETRNGATRLFLQVLVPVTSLCPCSKKISQYGAHNQRSHVTINAELAGDVAVEDLIRIAEEEASCELWGLLKRPDEKFVTERAYENPKFVEDLVRDVAQRLNADERIAAYVLEAENFESIHNHSAYAVIERDKRVA